MHFFLTYLKVSDILRILEMMVLLYIALPVNEIQKGTCNFVGRIYVHIGTSHNGGEEMERFATFTQDAWPMLFIIDWSWKLEA